MTERSRIRVLSVDDHPMLREGIAAVISIESDLELVSQAAGGREAILRFREHRPDVTLMDLRMPDLNGIEALARIREEFPEARIILLTTFDVEDEFQRARDAGACGCLLKGGPPRQLTQAIREVHAGSRWVSSLQPDR